MVKPSPSMARKGNTPDGNCCAQWAMPSRLREAWAGRSSGRSPTMSEHSLVPDDERAFVTRAVIRWRVGRSRREHPPSDDGQGSVSEG